jgi:hypothetical protein
MRFVKAKYKKHRGQGSICAQNEIDHTIQRSQGYGLLGDHIRQEGRRRSGSKIETSSYLTLASFLSFVVVVTLILKA